MHLAEDVRPFIAMAKALRHEGFSAPEIYAADLDRGLLILEDLGSDGVVAGNPPSPSASAMPPPWNCWRTCIPARCRACCTSPRRWKYVLPTYTIEAFLIEVELMLDWYLPFGGRAGRSGGAGRIPAAVARRALDRAARAETWVLRDYHSPNLIWMDHRRGLGKVGLIDFQDAVLAAPPMTVASLAQDARVDVPETLEVDLLDHYIDIRQEAEPTFDATRFEHLYALMGAQRAPKILGIFARLNARDGKPQYLRHLPRIRRYLAGASPIPKSVVADVVRGRVAIEGIPDVTTISRAMVLAAGHGHPLRPLTDHRPKPLVEVDGPRADRQCARPLEASDIREAVVNVHHHADQLEQHLALRTAPPRIHISDERGQLLGNGGGIRKALLFFHGEPFSPSMPEPLDRGRASRT